jgi:hypothetical protein
MALSRKDLGATVLTALAVLVFAATRERWSVWLVGDNHRWAAGAVLVLGVLACGLGCPGQDAATKLLAALGIAAGALAVLALVTGSLAALALVTADVVLLWAGSLFRHASAGASPVSVRFSERRVQ